MSKQANKSLIGAFVIGALALVVAGTVVFSSGKLFRKTLRNVMFFEGSVKGLKIGAPVVFRGVQIGQVTDIVLDVNERDLTAFVPVYIEIYQEKVIPREGGHAYDQRYLQALIEKGLRAQLQLQSIVTGQLMIDLDFHPNSQIRLVGLEKRYPEIPTIPSGFEQLTRRLEELPLNEIADRLNETLAGMNKLINSRELQASIGSLNELVKNTNSLVQDVRSEIGPLASEIRGTTDAARAAFAQAERTLRLDDGAPGQIASSIKESLATANATLKETQTAIENFNAIAVRNANLGYEIGKTLEQIAEASRSIRLLADYLERHPEALLRGKSPAKGE